MFREVEDFIEDNNKNFKLVYFKINYRKGNVLNRITILVSKNFRAILRVDRFIVDTKILVKGLNVSYYKKVSTFL